MNNSFVKGLLFVVVLFVITGLVAQDRNSFSSYSLPGKPWYKVNNEYGISIGSSFMLSDLGGTIGRGKGFLADFDLIASRAALGFNYRNNYSQRIALRLNLTYTTLSAADENTRAGVASQDGFFRRIRQFDTRTHLGEAVLTTEYNFKPFVTGDLNTRFTPFVGLGVGVAYYQPQTLVDGKWRNLRPLHTEGQMIRKGGNNAGNIQIGYFPLREQYSLFTLIAPINIGVKYNYSRNVMFVFEIGYRFTNTDYLDDVSRSYPQLDEVLVTVGVDPNSTDAQNEYNRYVNPGAFITDDEGVAIKPSYGVNEQRGNPSNKDGYGYSSMLSVYYTISKSASSYNCPSRFSF